AVDYITKPVNFTITHARIKTHIELKFQRDYLANLSLKDGITGVSNRRRFDKGFERAHENAIKSQKSLSLLMIDIDFFKQYNDYHGYLTGDDVLKTVATTIEEAIESMFNKTENLVARLDGKRFVCMLPNVAYEQMNSAGQLIINSVRSLNIHHELSTVSDVLTVSIGGVSFVPNRGDRLEDAIEGADEMLYRAKEQGRNRLSI
ncbi:MAG: diguanylate cyclase, partial [Chromatiales bacterium]|nr:diguanylate cyclase [Chromatiales bacterium]